MKPEKFVLISPIRNIPNRAFVFSTLFLLLLSIEIDGKINTVDNKNDKHT